jgi:hypothetical protein
MIYPDITDPDPKEFVDEKVLVSQKDRIKDLEDALREMIAAAREINRCAGRTVFNPTALSMAVAALDAK